MTAVTRLALDRLKASSITSSSIRFSLTGGPVGCTTNTSAPRTLSWIWNHTSPSEKRERWARPSGTPRKRAIDSPRTGCALPVKTLSSGDISSDSRSRPCRPPRPPVGWGGRIRTFEYGVQSPAPYRLATPQPGPYVCGVSVAAPPGSEAGPDPSPPPAEVPLGPDPLGPPDPLPAPPPPPPDDGPPAPAPTCWR